MNNKPQAIGEKIRLIDEISVKNITENIGVTKITTIFAVQTDNF